ncbi:MAG: flagellar export chaperone FlgN [Dehalococcoidia bacterium]
MTDALDTILAILDEELAIYQRIETLAEDEAAALRRDDLAALRSAAEEQAGLVETLVGKEKARIALVGREITLGELAETIGGAAGDQLLDRRDALSAQVARVRLATDRAQAMLSALSSLHRERLQAAVQSRSLYGESGQSRTVVLPGLLDRRA